MKDGVYEELLVSMTRSVELSSKTIEIIVKRNEALEKVAAIARSLLQDGNLDIERHIYLESAFQYLDAGAGSHGVKL